MTDPHYPISTKYYTDEFLHLVTLTADMFELMHQVRTLYQLCCHIDDEMGEKSIPIESVMHVFGWKGGEEWPK